MKTIMPLVEANGEPSLREVLFTGIRKFLSEPEKEAALDAFLKDVDSPASLRFQLISLCITPIIQLAETVNLGVAWLFAKRIGIYCEAFYEENDHEMEMFYKKFSKIRLKQGERQKIYFELARLLSLLWKHSSLNRLNTDKKHLDPLNMSKKALIKKGITFVIKNVMGEMMIYLSSFAQEKGINLQNLKKEFFKKRISSARSLKNKQKFQNEIKFFLEHSRMDISFSLQRMENIIQTSPEDVQEEIYWIERATELLSYINSHFNNLQIKPDKFNYLHFPRKEAYEAWKIYLNLCQENKRLWWHESVKNVSRLLGQRGMSITEQELSDVCLGDIQYLEACLPKYAHLSLAAWNKPMLKEARRLFKFIDEYPQFSDFKSLAYERGEQIRNHIALVGKKPSSLSPMEKHALIKKFGGQSPDFKLLKFMFKLPPLLLDFVIAEQDINLLSALASLTPEIREKTLFPRAMPQEFLSFLQKISLTKNLLSFMLKLPSFLMHFIIKNSHETLLRLLFNLPQPYKSTVLRHPEPELLSRLNHLLKYPFEKVELIVSNPYLWSRYAKEDRVIRFILDAGYPLEKMQSWFKPDNTEGLAHVKQAFSSAGLRCAKYYSIEKQLETNKDALYLIQAFILKKGKSPSASLIHSLSHPAIGEAYQTNFIDLDFLMGSRAEAVEFFIRCYPKAIKQGIKNIWDPSFEPFLKAQRKESFLASAQLNRGCYPENLNQIEKLA